MELFFVPIYATLPPLHAIASISVDVMCHNDSTITTVH